MRLWIGLAFLTLLALGWTQTLRLRPMQESGLLPIRPPTPYIHYWPSKEVRGRVLVVHGLNANKEFMRILSAALADSGFEVFSIDLPGHGDSRAAFDGLLARQAILNTLQHLGRDTIAVGHSFGAGLLLDVAAEQNVGVMVLLSPAPVPLDRVHAGRTLVVTGRWDIPHVSAFIPVVLDAGGPDFKWWRLNWAAHSSAMLNPAHIRAVAGWMGGDTRDLKTAPRLAWIAVMLLAGAGLGLTLFSGHRIRPAHSRISNLLVCYVTACGAAIVALKAVEILSWIRVFAMDYLIAFLLVTGVVLCLLGTAGRPGRNPWRLYTGDCQHRRLAILKGLGAAAFVIAVLGILVISELFHTSLSAQRWWRFPVIAAAALPLFLADEAWIRPITPRWKSAAAGIVTRMLLGAFLMTGVLLLNREDGFLALAAHLMVWFWIALWFATGAVHRRTQDPFAAAIFASVVQGWALAAIAVVT